MFIASIILNMVLLAVISVLIYLLLTEKAVSDYYIREWSKWECRWYEAQNKVSEELGYHLSPSGLRTEVELKKHLDK